MSNDWARLQSYVGAFGPLVRVSVVDVQGSAPRNAGSWMIVTCETCELTIGGGRLEYEAISTARALLDDHYETHSSNSAGGIGSEVTDSDAAGDKAHKENGLAAWQRCTHLYPLGPALGQCCGGAVRLLFEVFGPREIKAMLIARDQNVPCIQSGHNVPGSVMVRPLQSGAPLVMASDRSQDYGLPLHVLRVVRAMLVGASSRDAIYIKAASGARDGWYVEPVQGNRTPLYIYGAGHVGRAIVEVIKPFAFQVRWVDTARARFPDQIPAHVAPAITDMPQELAHRAPANAFHLVLTYSHELDLAICQAILARARFSYLGLIGSQTKRARFLSRLRAARINEAALAKLVCPIGIASISGKEPAIIALSVAAQLVERLEVILNRVDKPEQGGIYG